MHGVSCDGIGVVLGSGAYFYMTGDKKKFSILEEKDLQIHIEMGDYGRYNTTDWYSYLPETVR